MNNHDENKKYFKSTFEVFHAPNDTAKEVLSMAKKLNDNENTKKNITQEVVTTQAERVSHIGFGKWIAVACVGVLAIGSGAYLYSVNNKNIEVGTDVDTYNNEIAVVTDDFKSQKAVVGESNDTSNSNSPKYNNFLGKFNDVQNINISYERNDDSMDIVTHYPSHELTSQEVDLLNSNLNLSNCATISEEEFLNNNPKFNESLLDEYSSASIMFTMQDKQVVIFIINDNIDITYYSSNGSASKEYYSIENTNLLDTIVNILDSQQSYDTEINEEVTKDALFGLIPLDKNNFDDDIYSYGTSSITGSSSLTSSTTVFLDYDDLQTINDWSNYSTWTELDNVNEEDYIFSKDAVSLYIGNQADILIRDTLVKITIPNDDAPLIYYYSTNETCGTDTFSQRVASLIEEKSNSSSEDNSTQQNAIAIMEE